ncbi:MAG: hypothetical protein AAFN48_12270, partial [Pseudomonadota bacterium]
DPEAPWVNLRSSIETALSSAFITLDTGVHVLHGDQDVSVSFDPSVFCVRWKVALGVRALLVSPALAIHSKAVFQFVTAHRRP